MAINIGSNFSYSGKKFLDDRVSKFTSLSDLRGVSNTDSTIPPGFEVYIDGEGWYRFSPNSSPSEETGYFEPRDAELRKSLNEIRDVLGLSGNIEGTTGEEDIPLQERVTALETDYETHKTQSSTLHSSLSSRLEAIEKSIFNFAISLQGGGGNVEKGWTNLDDIQITPTAVFTSSQATDVTADTVFSKDGVAIGSSYTIPRGTIQEGNSSFTFTATYTSSSGTTFSAQSTVSWNYYFKGYYGYVSGLSDFLSSPDSSKTTKLKSLSSELKASKTLSPKSVGQRISGDNTYVYAYPSSFGELTKISDESGNYNYIEDFSHFTVSLENDYGVETEYLVYYRKNTGSQWINSKISFS